MEKNFYDYNTRINLYEIDFRMAFSVEGYLDEKIKDDPKYVKLLARMFYKKDGVPSEKILSLHKCDKRDWDQFEPAAIGMEDQM